MNPATLQRPSSPGGTLKPIPVERGLVVRDYLHLFYEDVLSLANRIELEHGNVFCIGPPFIFRDKTITFLLGPDAVEFVLYDAQGNFSSRLGWDYFIDRVFPGAIMAMDGETHRYQRRIMTAAFSKSALKGYVELMNPTIAAGVRAWGDEPDFRAFHSTKRLTLGIAAAAFMGVDFGSRAARVDQAFIDCVEASIARLRWAIPPFQMWRGVRGRAFLERMFYEVLPDKQARQTPDIFSRLCHAESENGERFTDREIVDHMIFLMMAAHDTSTSTITTMIYLLAKHPAWQERCRESALALQTESPDYEQLNAMEELGWVLKESLRIYPPLPCMPRRAMKECLFEGYRIEAGDLVGVFPIHTHHMQRLWTDPERFDPERFSPARAEDKSHRCAWSPFGGGAHVCIGQHFGQLEIKLVLHQMLLNYRWSVPENYTLPYQLVPIAKARDGAPIQLQRLERSGARQG